MNNNPYDQNRQNTASDGQRSFNNNPYAQYGNNGTETQDISNSYVPQSPVANEKSKMNGLAIASMILGIASLCCCCSSYICGILAVVFGIIARFCGNRSGKSLTGIICGVISLVLTTFMFIIMIVAVMFNADPEASEMALMIVKSVL